MEEPQFNLMYMADFYKVSHKAQYPKNVTHVSSTLVARGANYNDQISKDKFFWFGAKLFIEKLQQFEDWFLDLSMDEVEQVLGEYKGFLDARLGGDNSIQHWFDLWFERELPLTIHIQPERTWQNFQTPLVVVENTSDKFPWLTSFIETTMLSNVWGVTTAANRAAHIRQTIESYMEGYTDDELAAVDFMGHDFSYRGILGDEGATLTGCGHLSVFKGSDSIPAARAMERVYGEVTGFSVPATEHSVMCAGGQETEAETYNRILDIYPSGIVSIVSDTWDYFKVLTETIPAMKDRIMARDGKVVIRPDSGDPVDIVCGTVVHGGVTPEQKGTIELLDETFGHTLDSAGLKVLDSHIGVIYGDGMNQERIKLMLDRMVAKGYSPLNIVFGIGAYTYQFMTRDELGFAFKATAVKQDGEWVSIQKDPKTDPGKKSLTGRQDTHGMELVF